MSTAGSLVVLLSSLCVLCTQIGCGLASVACSTSGELSSTCHLSDSCYEEHSIPEQEKECEQKPTAINKTTYFAGYNVTECEPYPGGNGFSRCRAMGVNLNSYLVAGLSYDVVPLDARYFSMSVGWTWLDFDIRNARQQLVGYELRISLPRETVKCLCIWEPDLRNVSLGFDPVLRYRASSEMKIELFTLPYQDNWQLSEYSEKEVRTWPETCNDYDVTNPTTFCPGRRPVAPTIVDVQSTSTDGTKELNVTWIGTNTAHSHSEVYYARVADIRSNLSWSFVVNRSRNIKVSGLPSSTNYSAQVQGYSLCSGISSFYSDSISNREIGCGIWSDSKDEQAVIGTTSFLTSPSVTLGETPISGDHNNTLVIASVVTIASLILAILLAVLLCVAILLYHKKRHMEPLVLPKYIHVVDPMVDFLRKPEKLDALVLYSQSTPTLEQVEIEKYVVGVLKQERLKVLSCNDHTEKTIVQWVEENARSAHTVFIVCNKHFCKEWTMQFRTKLINSLDAIIASDVGQKKINKYATVLLRPSDEQYIPENLYLKGMKSFVMGARATHKNRAEFISFIKLHRLYNKEL